MKTILTILALACAIGSVGFSQTGYTDPSTFDQVLTNLVGNTPVNFDSQAKGSEARVYGPLTISSTGLDSDGLTVIDVYTIATSAFPPRTSPNTLGAQGADQQFLAGNSDSIVFHFSTPVHAFGLFLIGNPSPTGDPPIPFWKMRMNVQPSSFEALSDTTPLYDLGTGNDVYFLGVISPRPFDNVTLYADNDPAAVFSFNVDDLIWATLPPEVALGDVKTMASGKVTVSTVVVTRVHGDERFNVETPDRLFGIAVLGTGAARGKSITFVGTASSTSDDECVVELGTILEQVDSTPPKPIGMLTRSLGGATSCGLQIGITGSQGPNNIGLDGRIWGKITAIGPDLSWITVDDGVGFNGELGQGVEVTGAINGPSRSIGEKVQITGSISLWKAESGNHYPLIRVAESGDLVSYGP